MRTTSHPIAKIWPLALSCFLACGGDDSGEAPPGNQGPAGTGASAGSGAGNPGMITDLRCVPGQLQVRGMVAGALVEARTEGGTHAFINKLGSDPGSFEVMSGEVSLRIWFDELLPNGRGTAARGTFSNASVDAGNCESGDSPSAIEIDEDGDGVTFVLNELHAPPYCQGAPVAGMLTGCFRYPPSAFP